MATLASLTVDLGIDTAPVVAGARRTMAAIRSIGASVSGMTRDADGNWSDLEGRTLSAAHAMMSDAQRVRDALGGVGQTLRAVGVIARQGLASGLRSAGTAGLKTAGTLGKAFGVMSLGAVGAAGALAAVPLAIAGLGVAVAAQSAEVKSAFSGLKDHVMGEMKQLAQPLVKPLADAAKQMQGIFDDIAPQLGEMFKAAAPMIEPLVGGIGELVKGMMPGFVSIMEKAQPVIEGLADGLGALGDGIGGMFEGFAQGIDSAGPVLDSLLSSIGGILPVIGQLMGKMLEVAGPILSKLLDALGPIIEQLGAALMPVIDALGPVLDQLVVAFLALVKAVMPLIPPILQLVAALLPALTPLLAALVPAFAALGEIVAALVPIIEMLIPIVAAVARVLAEQLAAFITSVVVPALQMIAAILRGDFSKAWELAKQAALAAVKWLYDTFIGLPAKLGAALAPLIGRVWQIMKDAGSKALEAARKMVSDCISKVKELPGKAKSALSGIGSALMSAGKDLIRGFINGISSMFSSVKSKLGSLTSMLPDWKGPVTLDRKILTPNGQTVISGFMAGIERKVPALRKQLQGITSDLPGMAMSVSPKGVARASVRSAQSIVFDVTGADEDMKRLIRRIVKNDGRGSVQTAFGTR